MIAINRMHTNYPGSFPGLLRDLFIYEKIWQNNAGCYESDE